MWGNGAGAQSHTYKFFEDQALLIMMLYQTPTIPSCNGFSVCVSALCVCVCDFGEKELH